jgi:hypothetical protein
MIPLTEVAKVVQLIEAESETVVAGRLRRGDTGVPVQELCKKKMF